MQTSMPNWPANVKAYTLRSWIDGDFVGLGTDGFGRSESRSSLREYFEVNARHIAWAAIESRVRSGELDAGLLETAAKDLEIDPAKLDPLSL